MKVHVVLCNRPFQILLRNFLATFRILSNFLVKEQLLTTFRKTSTFLVTFGLFWTKMLNNPFFKKINKLKLSSWLKVNIFLVKLIFLPFEWVSCGRSLNLVPRAFPFSWGRPPREGKSPGNEVGVACGLCVNKMADATLSSRLLNLLSNFL